MRRIDSLRLRRGTEAFGVGGGDQDFQLAMRQIHRVSLCIHRLSLFDTMNARQ
jgi:hypothetical protein